MRQDMWLGRYAMRQIDVKDAQQKLLDRIFAWTAVTHAATSAGSPWVVADGRQRAAASGRAPGNAGHGAPCRLLVMSQGWRGDQMPTPDELVPAARSHAADLQRQILHDQQSKSVKLSRRQQKAGAGANWLARLFRRLLGIQPRQRP